MRLDIASTVFLFWLCVGPTATFAQMVESQVAASNGVIVNRNSDDFAGRYEYSAPTIEVTPVSGRGSGFALVAKVVNNGVVGNISVHGAMIYSGEWQHYTSAVFRGGDPAEYIRTGADVGRCNYGCTLTESYIINLTMDDIQKHAIDGFVAIQIRASKTGNTAIINIPVSYIDAVNEVAK